MNMDTRERIVLYVIVLALAIVVVFLALTGNGGGCPDCDKLDQRLNEIDTAIDSLGKRVDAVDGIARSASASISAHDDKAGAAHSQMAGRLGGIEVSLAGLEGCAAELCPGKCGGACD